MKVVCVFGTRPEAIKLAPVIQALGARAPEIEAVVCVTAQHREMLDQVLRLFRIAPAHDLNLMQPDQHHVATLTTAIARLRPVFETEAPDLVLVQGDTTTTLAASLASAYLKIPVGHVEAGLRTYDPLRPFPEEINRRVTGAVAALHFAPTAQARANLLREGVADETIHVTGNTGIDALLMTVDPGYTFDDPVLASLDFTRRRVILVTAHRRESFGGPLAEICRAVRKLAEGRPEVEVVVPVHPNPNVRAVVHDVLGDVDRVHLLAPFDYQVFANLMARVSFILTDSGGIQEEAPSLGKPVLVLRDVTERPEAVAAGTARVVGTDAERILREATLLLDDRAHYAERSTVRNPFGDGKAADRIAEIITTWSRRRQRGGVAEG